MNHFVSHYGSARLKLLGILVLAGIVMQPAIAFGQPAAAPAPAATKPVIPRGGLMPGMALRSAPTLTPAQKKTVTDWVTIEVAAMAAGDPTVLSQARGTLITASAIPDLNPTRPPKPASAAYQSEYAAALEKALLKQFVIDGKDKRNPDARVRLNAAVTLAKVASQMAQGLALVKSTELALDDPSEAVVMWGVRAAKEVYPNLLVKADAEKLGQKIIRAVRRFPMSNAVVEDAFAAIAGTPVNPQRAAAGLESVIALLQARAHNYAQVQPGVVPGEDTFPARPDLDPPVMSYLALNWNTLNAAQKKAAGRAIIDQANEIVRVGTPLPPPHVNNMMRELRNVSSALEVVCLSGAPAGAPAAKKLGNLAVPAPAAPLMQAELAVISGAMKAAGILGDPKPTDAAANPAIAIPAALNK